jgi:hypothetical protein
MNVEALPAHGPSKEELRAMPYWQFLETGYWKDIAASVKKRDGHRCVVCNSSKSLAAHHRTYAHHGEEHLFLGDLTTLCEKCHTRHHFPPPPAREPIKPKKQIAPVIQFETKAQMRENRFFRRAAKRLKIPQDELRKIGRARVRELIGQGRKGYNMAKAEVPINPLRIVGDPDSVVDDMPPGDPIMITEEILDKCRANGSFTTATVLALGLRPGGLKKGWALDFIGRSMSRAQLLKVMGGRHIYAKSTMKRKANKASHI